MHSGAGDLQKKRLRIGLDRSLAPERWTTAQRPENKYFTVKRVFSRARGKGRGGSGGAADPRKRYSNQYFYRISIILNFFKFAKYVLSEKLVRRFPGLGLAKGNCRTPVRHFSLVIHFLQTCNSGILIKQRKRSGKVYNYLF